MLFDSSYVAVVHPNSMPYLPLESWDHFHQQRFDFYLTQHQDCPGMWNSSLSLS
jgi:hypothetical protein